MGVWELKFGVVRMVLSPSRQLLQRVLGSENPRFLISKAIRNQKLLIPHICSKSSTLPTQL
ncbi:hypothetical protein ACS0TY_003924 [Phlomoides rotata]